MGIAVLKEGNFSVTKNKVFTLLNGRVDTPDLKMAVQPFLISHGGEFTLLDAGLGWMENGMMTTHRQLRERNIDIQQLTRILVSHLHKDHVGGLVSDDEGVLRLNFPSVKTYIQRREFEFAIAQAGNPSYEINKLNFLALQENVIWLDTDEDKITDGVSFKVTGGHSPFHQAFWIRENDETIFYGADNLPQRSYIEYQLAYKTDYDGKKALAVRQQWVEQANEERWKVLLYHDMKEPVMSFPR
jgi:glyoxylase-like metal-dependent hydrolase (beta-lactamase superfamily II)